MNQYAVTARDYFRDYLPSRYGEISDPEEFFASLGRQIQDQVVDLVPELAGPDPAGEDYLTKVGRLNAAKRQAEELVMADLVYSQTPEEDQDGGYYGTQEIFQEMYLARMAMFDEDDAPTPNAENDSAGLPKSR